MRIFAVCFALQALLMIALLAMYAVPLYRVAHMLNP
jgi:hypothetical protein